MKKRILAWLMTVAMVLSMVTMPSTAEETTAEPVDTTTEETTETELQTENGGLTLYSDDFTIENGVLLAYTGSTKVSEVTVPDGVTAIGDLAFYCMNRIQKINLPSTVERIGYSAFSSCYSLQEINLPEGLTYIDRHAFSNCQSLTNLKLPSTLTYIGEYAFYSCSVAEGEIVIADGVTEIGQNAFAECKKITGVTLPEGLTEISEKVFMGCQALVKVNLPDTIERIGDRAFQACKSLRSLDLPENLRELGQYVFYDCESLKGRLTMPDRLEEIPIAALGNNRKIEQLVIGANVQWIYSPQSNTHAFYGLDSVTDVIFTGLTVPNSEWYNPDYYNYALFTYMPALQNVWVPEEAYDVYLEAFAEYLPEGVQMVAGYLEEVNTEIGDNLDWSVTDGVLTITGSGEMYDFGANGGPWASQRDSITSVVIESGVTSIGAYAFSNMGKITSITAADTVTAVGEGAFYYCGKLETVTLPGVTEIGKQAFYSCDSLTAPIFPTGMTALAEGVYGGCAGFTEINIPDTITSIGTGAFEKCVNLTSVTIPASVIEIGDRPFDSCTKLTDITVDEANIAFASENGALYDQAKTTLFQYPAGREGEAILPDTVTVVADHAFRMAKADAIRFKGDVPQIGDHALESTFVKVRYPYTCTDWEGELDKTYGASSITWTPYDPVTGYDLAGSRLSELTALDFMAFSQLAYRDFTNEELGKPIEVLVEGWRTYVWGDRDITYAELTEHIGNWMPVSVDSSIAEGYYAVLFRNGYGEAVLAYRGSTALTDLFEWGTEDQWDAIQDWIVNDLPMEVFDQLSGQVYLALNTLDDVLWEYEADKVATTGHSLGGALANIAAARSGIRCESVNAISSLDTVYATEPGYMGSGFKGVSLWDIEDHANEHDILAGVFEKTFTNPIKPYAAHESVYGSTELGGNHSIHSMLTRDSEGKLMVTPRTGGFSPTTAIESSLMSSLSMLKLGQNGVDRMTSYVTAALHNILYGGSAGDKLIGGMVGDTLVGGPGNDSLDGGYGDDTYHYFRGHGVDTIYDVAGADQLNLYGFAAKEIGISSDEDFVHVLHNGETIVRISKNSRSGLASDFMLQIFNSDAHQMAEAEISLGKFLYSDVQYAERVAVACPVEIEILDGEGNVVYTVADGTEGEYYTEYGNFYVYLEENGEYGKVLDLREGYTVRIRGLDDGTMAITHWDVEGETLTENGTTEDVPVSDGSEASFVSNKAGGVRLTDDQGGVYLLDNTESTAPRGMEYIIHGIGILDGWNVVEKLPAGPVTISIAVSNKTSTRADTLLLGLYDSDGRMVGMKTAVVDIMTGRDGWADVKLDNSDGAVSTVRAFIVPTFRSMTPLAETKAVGE